MEEFSMSENAKDLIQQEIDRNPFLVLSKLVYQQIYREIINGNLLPQHRIVESKIAKELNVSYQIVFSYTKDLRNSTTDERSARLNAKYEEFNKKHAK